MDEASRAQEDLAMIRRMMEDARQVVHGGGGHFVLWGVLTVTALLVTFGVVELGWSTRTMWVWPVAVVIGWIGSAVLGRAEYLRSRRGTAAIRYLGAIWVGVGIALTLLGLLGIPMGAIAAPSMGGVMACVLGAGFFASGFIYGAWWVGALAGGWWLGGIAMLIWPGAYTLLLLAAMLVGLQIVPGVIFMRRAKREAGRAGR